ncbi:GGDEF domain-containing protein [Helicobacter mesocricetorum]|uniref:GGDEF domain-containing protein n=1 Tax=Helicobacter mesocricetorum TaxID=87012 RepID=UPI000CF17B67|nr:diguanylate cyclase [Helicobacter mesocricetorum]
MSEELAKLKEAQDIDMDENQEMNDSEDEAEDVSTIDIQGFSKEVLDAMSSNDVAPLPENYKIYFEKLLKEKPKEFRDELLASFGSRDEDLIEVQTELELKVSESYNTITKLLQTIVAVHKNFSLLYRIVQNHKKEIAAVNNTNTFQNIIVVFEQELLELHTTLKKQMNEIRNLYEACADNVQDIIASSILDSKYKVFTRKYMESKVIKMLDSAKDVKHTHSFIIFKVSKKLEKITADKKKFTAINKTIVKILRNFTDKSDPIAHIGEGIFAVLLHYSDKDGAKRFANKICDNVSSTNIYFDGKEVILSVNSGILEINKNTKAQEFIENTIEALRKAASSDSSFVVFGG